MRRRPFAMVVAVVLVAIAWFTSASAEAAPSSGSTATGTTASGKQSALPERATFGIGPATANAGGVFNYTTGPGGSYVDKAVITNYSRFPLTLQVYQASLTNSADGGVQVSKTGQPLTDASTWLALPTGLREVHVPAASATRTGKAAVPFQLSVPHGAEPGDHAAAIVASLVTIGKNPRGQNVRLEQRIAARVYIRVDGPLHSALAVQNVQATYHGTVNPLGRGTAEVSFTVQNTGNVRLSFTQAVTAAGLFGTSAASAKSARVPVLFPGASLSFTRRIPDVLPTVLEHAHVTVSPTSLGGARPTAIAPVSAEASFAAVPWAFFGALVILLALVAVLLVARRRRRAGGRSPRSRHATKAAQRRAPGHGRPAGEMSRIASARPRRAGAALGVLAIVGATIALATPARADSAVPFTDPNARGYLGFCDASGKQVTSGNLSDIPFVYRAVSTAPAPAGYTVGAGAKATLFAYLPMRGVDPGDWSGQALTGSAFFSNPDHPMSEATVLDYSIGSFAQQVTTWWDHLIQLRMFIGQPNKSTYTYTYPAAVIKVTGSTWHVVQGGTVDCSVGKTKSLETLALPKSRFASASASIAAHKPAAANGNGDATHSGGKSSSHAGSARASGGRSSSGSPTGSGSAGSTASSGESPVTTGASATTRGAAAQADNGSDSSSPWAVIGVVAVALALVIGGALFVRRRRITPSA